MADSPEKKRDLVEESPAEQPSVEESKSVLKGPAEQMFALSTELEGDVKEDCIRLANLLNDFVLLPDLPADHPAPSRDQSEPQPEIRAQQPSSRDHVQTNGYNLAHPLADRNVREFILGALMSMDLTREERNLTRRQRRGNR